MPMLPPPLLLEQPAIIRAASHGAPIATFRPAPSRPLSGSSGPDLLRHKPTPQPEEGSSGPNDAPPPPKVTVPDLHPQKPADYTGGCFIRQ
jgi:hypothetical protein